MQAKMEPGNINVLQLSPTVQATKSNFSRVHKGKLPAYLDFFIDNPRSEVLIDQLQSEQGGRFLRKRNRNIVIRIHEEIEVLPDFCWLTLGEIKKLLEIDNFVNMDARSVISTIPMVDDQMISVAKGCLHGDTVSAAVNKLDIGHLNQELLRSFCCESGYYRSTDQIISWYTDQKVNYELNIESIALSKLKDWKISDDCIFNSNRYFSVIAVNVNSGTREVTSWNQPLIKDNNIGLLGFILKKINGILHFLIQAKVEPGNLDIIELSPTVSCSNISYLLEVRELWPPFMEYFFDLSHSRILFDTLQSEEGGRFYHVQNRNMIIEIDHTIELELPGNYIWMTLSQMTDFMKYSMFNIEARSLVSSLNLLPKKT
jgi:oxidase EvaA